MIIRLVPKMRSTLLAIIAAVLCMLPVASVSATTASSNGEQRMLMNAAAEFNVPESVLESLAYNQSRGESHGSQMSIDGGYGIMDLRTYLSTTSSARDGSTVAIPKAQPDYYTLDRAAELLHSSVSALKSDDQQNMRGAAAVLAQEAKQLNGGKLPQSINDWYGAIAAFSGASNPQTASMFADDVYATISKGVSITTNGGQNFHIDAVHVQPNKTALNKLKLMPFTTTHNSKQLPAQAPECPRTLNCSFVPAAYAQDSSDPADYGNFDYANRPQDMQIKYIFIHDTEGSYGSAVAHFQDPAAYDSAQYVIRSSDGAITQMVPSKDVSWGVGNWYMNMHGINIEHEGFAAQGGTWYTEAMYQSSATLVRWLANKYHIPLDRQHIIAHGDNARYPVTKQAVQHWDPGPYWDWNHYMDLIQGKSDVHTTARITHAPQARIGQAVNISPVFSTNDQPIQNCEVTPCIDEPDQGSNIVYMHTQPSMTAPLLNDTYMHPDGAPGTTKIEDWSASATTGFKYVVAAVQGDWTGVWFGGQVGWFYNPAGSSRTAVPTSSLVVTPRPGLNSIGVYANAYPEPSAYPTTIPAKDTSPMYTIASGQRYATTGENLPTDYFYDATLDYSLPDDHMIVRGHQKYYQISYNHHIGFVRADEVMISRR